MKMVERQKAVGGKKGNRQREAATDPKSGSCPGPARPVLPLQISSKGPEEDPPLLRPPVDSFRLLRDDRAQWLTHTHWGDNSVGSIWASVCVPLYVFVSQRVHRNTGVCARAHTHFHTLTHSELIKKDQPSRGDRGQLPESVKSKPASKKTKWDTQKS